MVAKLQSDSTPAMIQTSAVEQVVLQRAQWANTFRVMMAAAIGGWVVAGVLGVTVWELAHRPIPTRYFEAINGQLVQAIPADQPMLSQSEILTGAIEALESGFNMNFTDYRMRIEHAAKWFTPDGFTAYQHALFASGNMKTLRRKRLIMSIAITGAPVIVQKGILEGTHTYAWKVQVPVKVYYQGSGYESSKAHLATLILVRQNNLAVPRGWAVNSFVFGPMPQS
jgi:intracellular multiplication protein IcmL